MLSSITISKHHKPQTNEKRTNTTDCFLPFCTQTKQDEINYGRQMICLAGTNMCRISDCFLPLRCRVSRNGSRNSMRDPSKRDLIRYSNAEQLVIALQAILGQLIAHSNEIGLIETINCSVFRRWHLFGQFTDKRRNNLSQKTQLLLALLPLFKVVGGLLFVYKLTNDSVTECKALNNGSPRSFSIKRQMLNPRTCSQALAFIWPIFSYSDAANSVHSLYSPWNFVQKALFRGTYSH